MSWSLGCNCFHLHMPYQFYLPFLSRGTPKVGHQVDRIVLRQIQFEKLMQLNSVLLKNQRIYCVLQFANIDIETTRVLSMSRIPDKGRIL